MAPITWRNVDAPAFGASNNLLSAASNQIGNAGNKLLGALTGFEQGQIAKDNQQDALARQQAADALAASQFQQNLAISKQRADAGDLGNELTREANKANQDLAIENLKLNKDKFDEENRLTQLGLDKEAEAKAYQNLLGSVALDVAQASSIPGNNGAAGLLSALDRVNTLPIKDEDKAKIHSQVVTEIGARTNAEYDKANMGTVLQAEAEAAQIAKDRPYDPELSLKNTDITGDVLDSVIKQRGFTADESGDVLGGKSLAQEIMKARKTITDSQGRTVEVPYTSQEVELALKNTPTGNNWYEDPGVLKKSLHDSLKTAAEMVARNKDNQRQQEDAVAKLKAAQSTFEAGKHDNLKGTISNLFAK